MAGHTLGPGILSTPLGGLSEPVLHSFGTLLAHVHAAPGGPASHVDFFTGFGNYMPRVHCLQNAAGEPDWPWIITLITLTLGVIGAYTKIMVFWFRAYFQEERRDRNTKLKDLAQIFLWCGLGSYTMSIVMFFWPGYRLFALFLVLLNVWSWKFAFTTKGMQVSFSAKRLERQLRESLEARNAELEALVAQRTRDLEDAQLNAQLANEAKSRLLAHTNHEIRAPLTSIVGFTEMLFEHDLSKEEILEARNIVRENADHLLHIANEILDLSRIEAGHLVLESSECFVWDTIRSIEAMYRPVLKDTRVAFEVQIDRALPVATLTDPTRFRQILINLVSNAVKYTEAGTVRIDARPVTDPETGHECICIAVTDSGVGIDQESLDCLFDPFTRSPSEEKRRDGYGLGLSIARHLSRALGGDLQVESTPGKGSCFTLVIPHTSPEGAQSHDGPEAAHTDVAIKPSCLNGTRVLVVDDAKEVRNLVQMLLCNHGVEVTCAEQGRQALDILDKGPDGFDLILLDLHMPVLDGYQMMKALHERCNRIPVVVWSGNQLDDTQIATAETCCEQILYKPLRLEALVIACEQVIGRPGLQAAA